MYLWYAVPMTSSSGAASYSILSTDPPIFYVKHPFDEPLFDRLYRALFAHLHDETAWFLVSWSWSAEQSATAARRRIVETSHHRQYPGHCFIHLCNTELEAEMFREAGMEAVFCNQNAFVDERIFVPDRHPSRKFDAVCDARLKDYKRHQLAAKVDSLALLYAFNPAIDDPAFVAEIRRRFGRAHWFNHPEGGDYRSLTPNEINRCLNLCHVGLCLSAVEGANFASIQYLLCGLPVVSTRSRGGRDVFFQGDHFILVEDEADAVRRGVQTALRRRLDPESIRRSTLEKMHFHRQTLISLVQDIYDQSGNGRRFADEWNNVYFNQLYSWQRHSDTFQRLGGTAEPGSER